MARSREARSGTSIGQVSHDALVLLSGALLRDPHAQLLVDHVVNDPAVLLAHLHGSVPAAWFEVGTADRGPLDAARHLAAASRGAGAQTCLVLRSPDAHPGATKHR